MTQKLRGFASDPAIRSHLDAMGLTGCYDPSTELEIEIGGDPEPHPGGKTVRVPAFKVSEVRGKKRKYTVTYEEGDLTLEDFVTRKQHGPG